ncbi:MAG: hypothetical protein KGD57_00535 [Candidatus Lokiarchaeota archaeon]|nr:hypothetical protein [Candidatus Lokiarchaeota archaeon]
MCNHCKCENQEKCSIVDMKPIGFCCVKCQYIELQNICPQFIIEKQKQSIKFSS